MRNDFQLYYPANYTADGTVYVNDFPLYFHANYTANYTTYA